MRVSSVSLKDHLLRETRIDFDHFESDVSEEYLQDFAAGCYEGYSRPVYKPVRDRVLSPEDGAEHLGISVSRLREEMKEAGYRFPGGQQGTAL